MGETIKYTSKNGYTGVLYGKSSLSIYDFTGKEVLHTGFRKANTYEELVEVVETHPEFMEMLSDAFPKIVNDTEDDDSF